MPKVEKSASGPFDLQLHRNPRLFLLNKYFASSLEQYLLTIFILVAVTFASVFLKIPQSKVPTLKSEFPELKTAYSDCARIPVNQLSLSCGSISPDGNRFPLLEISRDFSRSLRAISNHEIRPILLVLDLNNAMHTRLSRVAPDCIYSARVNSSSESSIVNLCDADGGLFGTLALPDGTYVIEPVENRHAKNNKSSRKAHLVYKSRSLSFQSYDYSIPNASTKPRAQPPSHDATAYADSVHPTFLHLNNSLGFDEHRTRFRRSANSWDHYVEVLAVADYSMFLYHQNNLENYLLTLFSTAASIYRHPSLNAAINIVLVKITVLKQRMPEFEGDVAKDILSSFCKWQTRFNDPNEDSPNHHDVALFITRKDLCRGAGQCETLGLAELGMMCEPEKSCAIIEDNGLSTGFTITHELGHIFNLQHDQDDACNQYMSSQPNNFHIMAKTVRYDTQPWSWSPCSTAVLANFLDTKRYRTQCLLDPPVEKRYYDRILEMPLPGTMFSADQQCKFLFGSHASHCRLEAALMENETCTRLWCEGYFLNGRGVVTSGCRTHYLPWADGTPCGQNKWCHQGKCIGTAHQPRSKLDGGWGDWGQWEECSRTCGGGVQRALRNCDSPSPSGGGKYCVGQRERYRTCNILDCPIDTPEFRELQCSGFDYKDTGIHGVSRNARWVPKYDGVSLNERCKLYCHESGKSAFYLLKGKVADGTLCDQSSDDICIDGVCHKAGCDRRLGSELRRDRCGICGGDGTSCRLVSGSYNERGRNGYTEVVKIPAGASDIEITQHAHKNRKDDDNYLALRSANNDFILNGHYQVSVYPVPITVQKTVLWYSGSDNIIERINGSGPLRSDIYLLVLSVGRLYPPDIRYRYMVPLDQKILPQQKTSATYYWRVGELWTDCSSLCQGQQSQMVICTDAAINRDVSKDFCTARLPSVQTRGCNLDCFTKWRTVTVGPCSVTCGHGEMLQRSECIRQYTDGREEAVAEIECRNLIKPSERKACYHDCAGRKWAYSEWTQCSETCGKVGIMQRRAICVDQDSRPIDEKMCERADKEVTEKECNRTPCPKWVYSAWSECSRSCDGGVRVRHASCQDASGREVDLRLCNNNEKHDREFCNEHLCTHWQYGSWSACSVTCGEGLQTREAFCSDRDGRRLDQGRCDPRHRQVQKHCHRAACPTWRISSWSSCSVTCNDGWKTRRVSCIDANGKEMLNEQCLSKGDARPSSHEPCNVGACPYWKLSEWSQCSVSCGAGSRSRRAECVYKEKSVEASLCKEQNKPKTEEVCHMYTCAHWVPSPWSQCSVTCGRGVQKRALQCIRDVTAGSKTVVHESECDTGMRPKSEKTCDKPACKPYRDAGGSARDRSRVRWETTALTECSVTCGSGVQRLGLKCKYNDRDVSDEYCKNISRPSVVQHCRNKPCVKWVFGNWKPCSATCGSNVITERQVLCKSVDSSDVVNENDCDLSKKPASVRSCNLSPCHPRDVVTNKSYPSSGIWNTSPWGQCSTTCGPGWRRRSVTCSERTCNEKMKPAFYEQCKLRDCSGSNKSWKTSAWSRCPVTCGGGTQRREVWCEDGNRKSKVPDTDCSGKGKPEAVRKCALLSCGNASRHRLQSGQWSSVRSPPVEQREQAHYQIKKRRRYKA